MRAFIIFGAAFFALSSLMKALGAALAVGSIVGGVSAWGPSLAVLAGLGLVGRLLLGLAFR